MKWDHGNLYVLLPSHESCLIHACFCPASETRSIPVLSCFISKYCDALRLLPITYIYIDIPGLAWKLATKNQIYALLARNEQIGKEKIIIIIKMSSPSRSTLFYQEVAQVIPRNPHESVKHSAMVVLHSLAVLATFAIHWRALQGLLHRCFKQMAKQTSNAQKRKWRACGRIADECPVHESLSDTAWLQVPHQQNMDPLWHHTHCCANLK